jgi:hypothetical protein
VAVVADHGPFPHYGHSNRFAVARSSTAADTMARGDMRARPPSNSLSPHKAFSRQSWAALVVGSWPSRRVASAAPRHLPTRAVRGG